MAMGMLCTSEATQAQDINLFNSSVDVFNTKEEEEEEDTDCCTTGCFGRLFG